VAILPGAADFGPDEDGNITNSMEAHGTVSEHDFLLTISWPNGTRGRYSGTFQADDFLAGTTVDLQHPQSQASWISDRTFPRPPGLT
jgi:hypothetical protein